MSDSKAKMHQSPKFQTPYLDFMGLLLRGGEGGDERGR